MGPRGSPNPEVETQHRGRTLTWVYFPGKSCGKGRFPLYLGYMETLFIIGREPELSAAELVAIAPAWSAEVVDVQPAGVLLKHGQPLSPRAIDRLGGSIKQVNVLECYDLAEGLTSLVKRVCTAAWLTEQFPEGRVEFGVSAYGWSKKDRASVQHHFLDLKKELRAAGRVIRLATSGEPQLSAVTVHRNGLDKRGKEFVFFQTPQSIILGVTVAVQDYQAYAVRDYGRPAANPKSGMLPPKVAQMMLNIAQVKPNDILLDPFCGSGTIVQEALLLGVKDVHGSDSDPRAVKDSQENIRWLLKEYSSIQATAEITKRDATETNVKPSVIVTEPFLGRPLRGSETQSFIVEQAKQLEQLYRRVAEHWSHQLRPTGRLVMVWPEFVHLPAAAGPAHAGSGGRPSLERRGGEVVAIDLNDEFRQLGFEPQPLLSEDVAAKLNHGDRFVVTYGRDEARVRRQIRCWRRTTP